MRSWPGFLPPLVALAATVGAAAAFSAAAAGNGGDDLVAAWAVALRDIGPVGLAVLWAAAMIMARPHVLAVLAAAVGGGAVLVLFPAPAALPAAGAAWAGLAAGLALAARWRLDAALAVVAGLMLSTVILDIVAVPLDDQLALVRESVTPLLEESIPAGADEAQRQQARQQLEKGLDSYFALVSRIYPLAVLGNLLGKALGILVLAWGLVRLCGYRLPSWRPPPFGAWRVPFYLVWTLIIGLGLVILAHPAAVTIGLNLVMFAALFLAVQGVAVQFWVTARMFSPLGRIVFWTVMGLFLTPLVLASGVVLGLADQWLDLRGLDRASPDSRGRG